MVVAEGIETAEELESVQDAGARFGQGYLLARPAFPPPAVNWPTRSKPAHRSQKITRARKAAPRRPR